jgi:hypothetical protein
MMTANALFMLAIFCALLLLSKIESTANEWLSLVVDNYSVSALVLLITLNIFVLCVIPAIYNAIYSKRSIVTDEVRSKFDLAEKQPFAMQQLLEYAGKELETESLLLYQLVRSIRKLRANVLDNKFEASLALAKILLDKYVHEGWNTLLWYDMQGLLGGIQTPIQLLEKDSILELLEIRCRDKIVLPMFARMLKTQRTSF